jgi:hypothetical protein
MKGKARAQLATRAEEQANERSGNKRGVCKGVGGEQIAGRRRGKKGTGQQRAGTFPGSFAHLPKMNHLTF